MIQVCKFLFHFCLTIGRTWVMKSSLFSLNNPLAVKAIYQILEKYVGSPCGANMIEQINSSSSSRSRVSASAINGEEYNEVKDGDNEQKIKVNLDKDENDENGKEADKFKTIFRAIMSDSTPNGFRLKRAVSHAIEKDTASQRCYHLIIWYNFLVICTNAQSSVNNSENKRYGRGWFKSMTAKANISLLKELNVSIVNLIFVDVLIGQKFKEERCCPLEDEIIHLLDPNHLPQTSKSRQSKNEDAFCKICNILQVVKYDIGRVVFENATIIERILNKQKNPFDSTHDLFQHLNIYSLNNHHSEMQVDVAAQQQQIKQFVAVFATYVAKFVDYIKTERAKQQLLHLMQTSDYFTQDFVLAAAFSNEYLRHSKQFVQFFTPILVKMCKHNVNELKQWYFHFCSKHGTQQTISMIRRYGFDTNGRIFCEYLQEYPKIIETKWQFDEWIEIIVDPLIDDSTKSFLCQHPPTSFEKILKLKDKKLRDSYLKLLRLALVGDEPPQGRNGKIIISPRRDRNVNVNGAQKPLMSFGKVSVCNEMIENLLKGSIDKQFYDSSDITFRNHYFQDPTILSFLSSQNSIGCKIMEFVCVLCFFYLTNTTSKQNVVIMCGIFIL